MSQSEVHGHFRKLWLQTVSAVMVQVGLRWGSANSQWELNDVSVLAETLIDGSRLVREGSIKLLILIHVWLP